MQVRRTLYNQIRKKRGGESDILLTYIGCRSFSIFSCFFLAKTFASRARRSCTGRMFNTNGGGEYGGPSTCMLYTSILLSASSEEVSKETMGIGGGGGGGSAAESCFVYRSYALAARIPDSFEVNRVGTKLLSFSTSNCIF